MSGLKSDCRKFSPNVFNKTKCQNCFRTKESHSAEALENNRASRNVSKCGYLFVAPDWDFNVSVNRTKRWQRRWFVLFDDGELTYALDEFPDTIPQGTIDMNKVLDVSDAEGITGNDFAISITTPEKAHFIKGTSKEESKWWFDVLCRVSPRYLSRAKHKRNATFPCGKATIPTPAIITQEYCSEDDMRLNSFSRPKFLSTSEMAQNWLPSADVEVDEDVFTTKDDNPYYNETNSNNKAKRDVEVHNALNKLISLPEDILNESEKDVNSEFPIEKMPKDYLSELEESENRRRNRRYLKRENRIQRSQRSRNDGVSKMIPSKASNKNTNTDTFSTPQNPNVSAIAAAEKLEYLESIHTKNDKSCSIKKESIHEVEVTPESPVPRNERDPIIKTNLRKSESLKNIPTETESEIKNHASGLRRYHSFKGSSSHRKLKPSSGTSSLKRTKSSVAGVPKSTSTPITKLPIAVSTPSNSNAVTSLHLDISDESLNEGTFTRTGWLMRQTLTKDWSKHWFVLKDSSLTYYRDPSAEHCGIMDGILDLNQVSTIRELESDRFYAISLRMWDGKKHVLAAETDEFRCMWMQALQYASNLWSSASKEDFICTEIILPEHTYHHSDRSERISSPSSLLSLSYAEETHEGLETPSYSSDEQSEYFSLVDEDEISDLSSSPRTLPPSPPINRNVISLVKEKSRTRCNHGSKMNSPSNGCSEATCDYDNNKNSENQLNQDFRHKYQDKDRSIIPGEDVDVEFFDDNLINGDHSPASLLTPPAEFMNCSIKELLHSKSSLKSKSTEVEFNRNLDVSSNHLESKTNESKMCSTCSTIRSKLLVAQEEVRKLEKELKEAHANFDNLEMFSYKLTQDIKLKEENYISQIALMTAKIDDLTSKFTFAEKNYRQLKQKMQKSEGKERRRSSLKNREGLSLTKEYEMKLCDLEKKISTIETSVKRELFEVDESEISFSDSSSRLNESFLTTPESSETNTPTEPVSESKGFFSRLQSLMSKVENVNSIFSIKDDSERVSKNPKILLQVKNSEELSSLEESEERQLNDNQPNIKSYFSDYPKSLSECQIMLSQKLNSHFEWLKNSLKNIYECEKDNTECQKDKLLLVNELTCELNDLYNDICVSAWTEQKSLLLFEVTKILEKIQSFETANSLLKINATKGTFKTIFQTLCIALAEYENAEFSSTLISNIPQFHYFYPPANKIFPERVENTDNLSSASERLVLIESQSEDMLSSLEQAKLFRYENLWNILAEVPVQDDPVNKPAEVNSVLTCTTSIAVDIHRIAELQISNVPKVTSYLSNLEHTGIQQWCEESTQTLKSSLTNFLNELKEKCPMINENIVSFFKLNESTRSDIMRLIVELSFLSVCQSLLNCLMQYFKAISQKQEGIVKSRFLLHKKWLSYVEKSPLWATNIALEDIFQCPQCSVLTNLLYQSEESINWVDFVQKYNYINSNKVNKCFKSNLVNPQMSTSNTCANCDSKCSRSQVKSQKDVCNNVTCAQCDTWIQKFCTSENQRELEQRTLELKHNAELKQLEECIIKSSEIHEQEMLQKQNELMAVAAQLKRLKTEYEEQKQMLKHFYEEKLNFECESINENSIKDVYRLEIEDLKDMFKEGLIAIENSHNRITSEIERRHKDEIAVLEAEKQRALEIEAQATFTALEAIKKSHAQQLLEETALIKKDLLNKFQKEEEQENLYSKYGNELETLKAEILKITEMYSSKCLENVALEEKVNSLRQQLKEAHNELCNLLSKNREITSSLCRE